MFNFIRKHDWRLKTRKHSFPSYKCARCGEKIVSTKDALPKRGCAGDKYKKRG